MDFFHAGQGEIHLPADGVADIDEHLPVPVLERPAEIGDGGQVVEAARLDREELIVSNLGNAPHEVAKVFKVQHFFDGEVNFRNGRNSQGPI